MKETKSIYELVSEGTLTYCNLNSANKVKCDEEFEAKLKLIGDMFHCDLSTSCKILKSSENIIANEKEEKAIQFIKYINWFSKYFGKDLTKPEVGIIANFFNDHVPITLAGVYMREVERSYFNDSDEET